MLFRSVGRQRSILRASEPRVRADAPVSVEMAAEKLAIVRRGHAPAAGRLMHALHIRACDYVGRERDFGSCNPGVRRGDGRDERANARIPAVSADEDVADDCCAVREHEFVLPAIPH